LAALAGCLSLSLCLSLLPLSLPSIHPTLSSFQSFPPSSSSTQLIHLHLRPHPLPLLLHPNTTCHSYTFASVPWPQLDSLSLSSQTLSLTPSQPFCPRASVPQPSDIPTFLILYPLTRILLFSACDSFSIFLSPSTSTLGSTHRGTQVNQQPINHISSAPRPLCRQQPPHLGEVTLAGATKHHYRYSRLTLECTNHQGR